MASEPVSAKVGRDLLPYQAAAGRQLAQAGRQECAGRKEPTGRNAARSAGPSPRQQATDAAAALARGLAEQVDENGFLHASLVDRAWDLLAIWTAARPVAARLGLKAYLRETKRRYARLVRYFLRLVGPDGRLPWQPAKAPKSQTAALLRTAVEQSGDQQCQALAAALRAGGRPMANTRKDRTVAKRGHTRSPVTPRLPASAAHSEQAATALMRSGWSRRGARLTVLYTATDTRLDLSLGADALLSGSWDVDLMVDGRSLLPDSPWHELCWVSDAEADYLEIELRLAEGYRVQRQFLLAHQDRFAYLADVVLGPRSGGVAYRGVLRTGPNAVLRAARATREIRIAAGKSAVTVLPLALPEWRGEDHAGELRASAHGRAGRSIELRQTVQGRGLHAALFIDLDPRRQRRPLTWRQLTVAENRRRMPRDVAVGYRVMIGRRQWLFYRSLAPRGNRTLLGHNLATEMFAGRFTTEGTVEKLVEIE